jgi:hypothetical protein
VNSNDRYQFVVRCVGCKLSYSCTVNSGTSGYLWCPACLQIISEVDVSPWQAWIEFAVEKRRKLPTRAHHTVDEEKCSRDGIGAEMAACLCLCPGHLFDWMARSDSLTCSNEGQDLLAEWVGCSKPFEIKYTPGCSKTTGILYIRRRSRFLDLIPQRDVCDSIYVLFHGSEWKYQANCWADRSLFLEKGVMDPPPLPPGKPTFGGLHSRFHPFSTIAQLPGLNPAEVDMEVIIGS